MVIKRCAAMVNKLQCSNCFIHCPLPFVIQTGSCTPRFLPPNGGSTVERCCSSFATKHHPKFSYSALTEEKTDMTLSMDTRGFEKASRDGALSLDRYVTEISTFKDSLIIRAYTSSIRGAVTQELGENASVALAQTAGNHAGLLGSADIELVVTTQDSISKAQKKKLGLVAARAVFVDLRFTYTTTVGRQVITLQPLTPDLPSVDIAFQSQKWQKGDNGENGRCSYTAAKLHAARTAVKALNIMQHIYRLPKVPGQDLEQIVIGANWEVEGDLSFTLYLENTLNSIAAHSVSKAWREAALNVCHLLEPDRDAPAVE